MGGERPFAWLGALLGVLFFVSFACEVKAAAIPASTEAASKAPENEYDELTTDKFNPSSIYLEGHAIPKHPLPQPKPATIVHQSYVLSPQQKTELQRWNALTESKKLDEHRKAHAARARRIKQVPSKPKGSVKNAAPLKSNKPGGGAGAAGAKKPTPPKKTTTKKKTNTAKKVRFQDVSAKRGYPACNPSGALLGVNKTQFQHITRHLELSKLAYLIGKSLKTGSTALSASGGSVKVVDILTPGVKNQIFGEFNGAAFIAVDDSKKILYLVYRGTNSIQDILSDAKFDIVDYKINGKSMGYVHQGFYELYVKSSGFARLQAQMKKYPSYSVHFTGHSLGGALTQLASMDYAIFTGKTPFVVTFGSPRLGDSKWRTNYRPAVEHLRLIHDNDPVTQLPVFGTTNLLRGLLSLKLPDAVLYTHAADVAVKMLENGDFFCISDAVIAPDVNPLDHGVTKYIASLALMVQKN